MRLPTFLFLTAALVGVTPAGLAGKYDDLVSQGYRWVTVDGPYGCSTVADLQQIVKNRNESLELQMVEQLRAYYLTPGTLVQVVQEDTATGVSEVRVGGVTRNLWTLTRFLSKRPVSDVYGVIETPQQMGTVPNPSVTPTLDQSILLGGSPASTASPVSTASPTPAESPVIHAKPRSHRTHRAE